MHTHTHIHTRAAACMLLQCIGTTEMRWSPLHLLPRPTHDQRPQHIASWAPPCRSRHVHVSKETERRKKNSRIQEKRGRKRAANAHHGCYCADQGTCMLARKQTGKKRAAEKQEKSGRNRTANAHHGCYCADQGTCM